MSQVIRVRADSLDEAAQELVRINKEQGQRIAMLERDVQHLRSQLSRVRAAFMAAKEANVLRRTAQKELTRLASARAHVQAVFRVAEKLLAPAIEAEHALEDE